MRKLTVSSLLFMMGWGLGWTTHLFWAADPLLPVPPVAVSPPELANTEVALADVKSLASGHSNDLPQLLQRNNFDVVVERYESLQTQADSSAAEGARALVLAYARQLVAALRFSLAEQLLQRFLVATYRDVEARILLATVFSGQGDVHAAIDQLFEARGYAYRPAILQRINVRIRSLVTAQAQALASHNDQPAVLALYQHLARMEPDYAAWFMGLAVAQLALNDSVAAQRSLQLIAQDPDVGAQARAMLETLRLANAELEDVKAPDTAIEVAGIPLQRRGNHFIVEATPARGRSVQLLIDTGASLTIFTPAVMEQSGIRYQDTGRNGVFNTANGQIRAPIYILEALVIGDWQVSQLEVGILELGGQADIDGLLGMNFLSYFQFFIDQNEAVLRLSGN